MKKAYLEITNACNLACTFCHGTKRDIRFITAEEFTHAARELKKVTEYLYFHIMGEPLLHPELAQFFEIAGSLGLKVVITTNGTLLRERSDVLLGARSLYKVSISLHSYEVNSLNISLDRYLEDCFRFCEKASAQGKIAVMRLWNIGGQNDLNSYIIEKMHTFFDGDARKEWTQTYSGYRLHEKLYLEWGEKFDWPDEEADYRGNSHSCYGLRDQVGVLCDGTVVPCCLDADGAIALGNIFETPLEEILASLRAQELKTSFENRKVTEPLCQRCGFAAMKF